MKPARASLLGLTLLLGCGAGTPTPPTSPAIPALSGDWSILGLPPSPSAAASLPPFLVGNLGSSGNLVTGTLRAYAGFPSGPDPNLPCVSPLAGLLVSGTLDAAGTLTLNIPVGNGTATVTAILPPDRHTRTPGTLTIAGGACALPATPILITNFANGTGTYTGTLNQYAVNAAGITYAVPGTATPITVNLAESSTPNALGAFPVTGSVTATGACPAQFTLDPNTTISGGVLLDLIPPNPLAEQTFGNLSGGINPQASSLYLGSFLNSGPCAALDLQGNLTPQ